MANFFESVGKSSGLGFLFKGPDDQPLPATPVLSSQYKLQFFIGSSKEPIHLFDIDNITKTMISTEKKNFRPYGFTHKINLMRYEGWDIKITGKKTNPALNYLIQNVYELASASPSISPNTRVWQNTQPILQASFKLRETISQYPDESYSPRIKEVYEYNDCVITGYDEEVSDDNMPLTFTLSLFAKSRQYVSPNGTPPGDYSGKNRSGIIDKQIGEMIEKITNINS